MSDAMRPRENLVEFKFFPLEDFKHEEDGEVKAHYIPGNSYNCSRDPVHDHLRDLCAGWAKEGKIRVVPLAKGEVFRRVHVA